MWHWNLCENHRLQIFGVLLSLVLFPLPQAFCYGAGSSVSALRYLRSSQKKSLPLPASQQEQIAFGQYDGRTADEYYLQKRPSIPRGHQDRGDASTQPLPRARPGSGSRSPDTAHTSDEPDAQVPESPRDQSPPDQHLMWLLALWELALNWTIAMAPARTHLNKKLNPDLGERRIKEVHVPLRTVW